MLMNAGIRGAGRDIGNLAHLRHVVGVRLGEESNVMLPVGQVSNNMKILTGKILMNEQEAHRRQPHEL
jgi:hypothetical protein